MTQQSKSKNLPVKKKRGVGKPRATKTRPLTRKQELFVKELVSKDGQITMREAAINAGYPASSAHTRAYEMTNPHICPHVVAAIKSYRDELDEKYGINYRRHIRDLQTIRDHALENGAYSAAVQAEYRRGQAQGDIYVSKSEVRHGSIDSMSKDEVMKALKEIKQTYAPVTIDITPEGESNTQNRAKARGRILESDEDSLEEEFEEDLVNTA
jgi:phage terminase small subunit